jgi:hypothetical protein
MTNLNNQDTTIRASLLRIQDPKRYFCKTENVVLTGVNTQAVASIIGQSKRFWITDMKAVVIDDNGLTPCYNNADFKFDDLKVHIMVNGLEMTTDPMPLFFLNEESMNELFTGKILEPNETISFKVISKSLPGHNNVGLMDYPLNISITIKGYELV